MYVHRIARHVYIPRIVLAFVICSLGRQIGVAITLTFSTFLTLASSPPAHIIGESAEARRNVEMPTDLQLDGNRRGTTLFLSPPRKYPGGSTLVASRVAPLFTAPPRLLGSSSPAVGICLLSPRRHVLRHLRIDLVVGGTRGGCVK